MKYSETWCRHFKRDEMATIHWSSPPAQAVIQRVFGVIGNLKTKHLTDGFLSDPSGYFTGYSLKDGDPTANGLVPGYGQPSFSSFIQALPNGTNVYITCPVFHPRTFAITLKIEVV